MTAVKTLVRHGVTIAASVSCFDLYNIESQLPIVESSGVGLLHFDVVDGRFNDCFVLGLPTLVAIRRHTTLPIEVHLAVWEPERYFKQFAAAGADYIAVHYEAFDSSDRARRAFDAIRKLQVGPILALRAETAYEPSYLPLLKEVDWILKLTVHPGYSGQRMQPAAIDGMREVHRAIVANGLGAGLEADGNINIRTIPRVVQAGADILTGGTSGLFTADGDIAGNVRAMLAVARLHALAGSSREREDPHH